MGESWREWNAAPPRPQKRGARPDWIDLTAFQVIQLARARAKQVRARTATCHTIERSWHAVNDRRRAAGGSRGARFRLLACRSTMW